MAADRFTVDEATVREDWEVLSVIRTAVQLALEYARTEKRIGSSLQCSIVINVWENHLKISDCLSRYQDELEDIFVVSSVAVNWAVPDEPSWYIEEAFAQDDWAGTVTILPPVDHKCSRCWKYVAAEEDELCKRCDKVVAALPDSDAGAV